jgi:hypothetical protein
MKPFKFILLATMLWLAGQVVQAGPTPEVPEAIFSALRTGNSKELVKYFNTNVELVIVDKEGIYSKDQAELIVKNFFSNNAPISYSKRHEGSKDSSRFVIGQLNTSKGKFRIYFLMKNINGTFAVHQFRIENETN